MEKNKFTHGSLFSGIGGPEIAAEEMGWKNMFHCEINPFGRKILDYWYTDAILTKRLLIGLVCTMLMKESLIWARYCRNMNLEKLLPLRKVIWMLTDFIEKGKMQLT